MFYVHLFLTAMYKKQKTKKSTLYFQRSASAYVRQSKVLKLQKAVASRVKQVELTQCRKSKYCDRDRDELREGDVNWQHVKEHTSLELQLESLYVV